MCAIEGKPSARTKWARAVASTGTSMRPDTEGTAAIFAAYDALAAHVAMAPMGSWRRFANDQGGAVAQACHKAVLDALAPIPGSDTLESERRAVVERACHPATWRAVELCRKAIDYGEAVWSTVAAAIVAAITAEWVIRGESLGF